MKQTFSLSANIENGFAEGVKYIVTPNAKNAIHNIVNDFNSGIHSFTIIGTYGTGKSSFLLALEADLKTKSKKKYLLNSKSLSNAKSFEIINIVGDYTEMSTLLCKALNVEGSATSVLDCLINYYNDCQKTGKFLLIVVDEFGKILEHAAKNNPEKELYFLQKLSELVNAPTRQIMLLTTLHQNFGTYAKGLTEEQTNEWIKVKGRFKEITFVEPVEQLLFLASSQLLSCSNSKSGKNIETLYELAQKTHFVSKDFPLETAVQLFPLDLFSAYVITTAIQRYGQNERSLFTFLTAQGANSINGFESAEHKTFNLHNVYDYILYNFYYYLKEANADSMSWSSIQVSIERVEGQDWANNEELMQAVKIVKAIGMLNLFGTARFKLTESHLADYAREAMAIDNAKEIIQKLITKKIIRYAVYKERLMLFEGTDVDIEAEFREAGLMVPRPVNFVDELNVFFNQRVSPVKAHFYQKGTPRFFNYMICEEPIDIVPTGDTDGYIELIFSTHKNALEEIEKFSSATHHALIFAYFTNTEEIITHLHNIKKYIYLYEHVLDKNDKVAISEIKKLKDYEEALLNKAISDDLFSYKKRVKWVFDGKEQKVSSHRDFNQLLSNVCNQIYEKAPVMNNELFNKHKLSSSIAGARSKYIEALLNNSDKIDFGFEADKFPPEKTIYYSLLKNTGLHVDGQFMDKPSNNDIKTLWDACEDFLRSTIEKPRRLSELIKILSTQPYKIKDGFLDFWLPTYLFIKKQDYSLYGENGQYIPNFNIELFDLMKKHLGEFKIKAYAVDGVKVQLFNQYRRFLNLNDNDTIKDSSFIETIKPFLYFYSKQLNEYAKNTQKVDHRETIRFRDVLSHATDPEKAFLEDLPEALGYNDEKLHEPTEVQKYCQVIQRAVRELRGCYNALIDRIEDHLIASLGLDVYEYEEYVHELQNRLAQLNADLLTPRQKEFYQHFMSKFDKRVEWYQSVCYAVLESPLDRMRDEQEAKLLDEFVLLFKECEKQAVISKSLKYQIGAKEKKRSAEMEQKIDALLSGDDNLDVYTLMRILQKKMK